MRPRITVVLLALGTVLGYGSGLAHVIRAHHAHCAHFQDARFDSHGEWRHEHAPHPD